MCSSDLKTWDAQATRDYNTAFAQYKVDMEDWLNQLNRIDAAAATREQQRHNRAVVELQKSAEGRQLRKEAEEAEDKLKAYTKTLNNTFHDTGTALQLIKEAVKIIRKNPRMATGWGALLASAPNSDARSLANKLNSIKDNIALKTMQQLKEASPTGTTGFGAMNIPELELTKNKFGTADQADNPEALLGDLRRIAEALYRGRETSAKELAGLNAKKAKGK